jgi:DNA (cytosine-5)-methyltransferase 1
MRLLDLYCRKGGAARGYRDAGFEEIVGVDIEDHSDGYPYTFVQGDAIEYCRTYGKTFDAIHASPPCQCFSVCQNIHHNQSKHPDLVAATREALIATGRPYVIENVPGAPLVNPIVLCGAMFGLQVYRHRLFESNVWLMAPSHVRHVAKASYGHRPKAGEFYTVSGHFSDIPGARLAMGIDWMGQKDLSQAIPPAYTEYIGRQLIAEINHASI